MTKQKMIAGTVVLTAAVIAGVIGAGYGLTDGSRSSFPADGYVLEVKPDDSGQTVTGLAFASGTGYKGKFPASVTFKDIQGQRNIVKETSYIHYADGSISSFSDGMVVNMEEAGIGFLEFYKIDANMVMSSSGEGWRIDNNGKDMNFGEILWQLSEDKVLAASDTLTLELAGKEPEKFSGYLEIIWLDKDIVQVSNQEQVYQAVASDGKITYGSGAVLNLQEKSVTGSDGEVRFTLDELLADMDNGGITLMSESNVNWKPPEFNIQVENGRDGEAGADGDSGESGEAGQAGAAGEAGEAGQDGQEGNEGEEGQEGDEGDSGSQGGSGQAGTAGAAGERGASPGATGQNPSTSNAQEMGIIRISSLDYDCAEGKVQLSILDDDFTLREGRVEIRNVRNNQLVDSAVVNFGDGMATKEVSFKNLTADQEYAVIVKSDYSISLPSGVNTGTKTFVNRSFFTSSEGVSMEIDSLKEGELNLKLTTRPDSDAVYFKVLARIGDKADQVHVLDYPIGSVGELQNYGGDLLNLNLADRGAELGELWGSDIPYTLELYTSSGSVLNDGDWELDENGNFAGINKENGIKKSNYTISGRTLKAKPVLGALNVTMTQDGYYDMELEVVSDKDNSIREYIYEILPQGSEEPVRTLTSAKSRVNWYYSGDVDMGGSYRIRASVRYHDNEKVNLVSAQEKNLFVNAPDKVGVGFERYSTTYDETTKKIPENFVNSREPDKPVSKAVGLWATNASRIWGELLLYPNGRVISTDIRIEVTSNDDTQYRNVIEAKLPAAAPAGSDPYYIPVKCLGLKEDTAYLFSVYGSSTREIQTGAGSTITDKKENELLGSVTVSTARMPADYAENSHPTPAAFSLSPAVSDNAGGTIAAIRLYRPTEAGARFADINSKDVDSPFYFQRSCARAIEITIRSVTDNSILGIAVKDLYKADPGISVKDESVQTQIDNPNYVSEAEADFYNGPLTSWNWTEPIYLTVQDIETTGTRFPISQNYGKYILEASALYDYSYRMMNDYPSHRGKYMDSSIQENNSASIQEYNTRATSYNRIPLEAVPLDVAGSNNILNKTEVDMGLRPPELIDPADEAVTVTQIRNDGSNPVFYDPQLDTDTTVALKVQSNYPNRNLDTATITYYGMTLDAFEDFEKKYAEYGVSQIDIIDAYEKGNEPAKKVIRFKVTLDVKASGVKTGVPPLYVVLTDDEDKINKCRDGDSYKAVSAGGMDVFYASPDTIGRGDCYVFAFTLESYYGVDTTSGGNPQPWVFPYGLSEKTNVPYLGGKNLQRSHGTNIYKETPRVAAYLDHTVVEKDMEEAVWNYYVYDPDQAWLNDRRVYAGAADNILGDISADLTGGTASGMLLNAAVVNDAAGITYIDTSTPGSEEEYVAKRSFGLKNGWKEQRLCRFQVSVTNGSNSLLKQGYYTNPYELWLSVRQFSGELGVDENPVTNPDYDFKKFTESRLSDGGQRLSSEEYFAVKTVRHRFDYLGEGMNALKVKASMKEGSTELRLSLDPTTSPSTNIVSHLVGFYYEIHGYEGGTVGKLEQWGVVPYSGNNSSKEVVIPFEEPKQAEDVQVTVNAIYDTGVAGLNTIEVTSTLDEIAARKGKGDKEEAVPREKAADNPDLKYYAVQQQDSALYGTSMLNNGFSYSSEYASESLFRYDGIAGDMDDSRYDEDNLGLMLCRILDSTYSHRIRYKYDNSGAATPDKKYPVLKQLGETPVILTGSKDEGIEGGNDQDNKVSLKVPATIPNVVKVDGLNGNGWPTNGDPRGADITIKLEGKSNELLVFEGNPEADRVYSREVYFELYEYEKLANGKPDLTGIDPIGGDGLGRYFDITRKQGTFDNKWDGSKKSAYISAETAKKESGYKITVQNLEPNKKYCLKLYCLKKKDGQKEYLLDHREGGSGELLLPIEVTNKVVVKNYNDGSDSKENKMSASYTQTDYEIKTVTAGYRLNKTAGYYVMYSIENSSGTEIFTMKQLMECMGYTTEEDSGLFWYYDETDSTWKSNTHKVYSTANGTQFEYPGYDKSVAFTFNQEADLKRFVPDQTYKFKLQVFDLAGNELQYQAADSGTATADPPVAEFTVPPRPDPNYTVNVRYSKKGTDTEATLTVTVHDEGFYLRAVPKSGEGAVNGSYILNLYEDGTPLTPNKMSITPSIDNTAHGLFSKGTPYTITYNVNANTQYQVKIEGQNINKGHTANEILYNSDDSPMLKQQLKVSDLDSPQTGTVMYDFDSVTETMKITCINGLNLSTLNRISITLTDLETYESRSVVRDAAFKENGKRAVMEIPLADMLDVIGSAKGNALSITIRYSDKDTGMVYPELDMTHAFTY